MGWDITYHPFGADEITSVYFAGVGNPALAANFAQEYAVPEFHHDSLAGAFQFGAERGMDTPFNKGHGMYMAIVAGHLRRYWYVRGSAMSFLADDAAFKGYFSDIRALVPEAYRHLQFDNELTENYCCGVFMDHSALQRLKADMETDPYIRKEMEELFSHGRLEVFLAAVDAALEQGVGLLEASEILEPDPLDLNATQCLTNLHHCDPAGALLYQQATLEQLAALQAETQEEEEEASPQPETVASTDSPQPQTTTAAEQSQKKKGFFSRLFGKK